MLFLSILILEEVAADPVLLPLEFVVCLKRPVVQDLLRTAHISLLQLGHLAPHAPLLFARKTQTFVNSVLTSRPLVCTIVGKIISAFIVI